MSSSDYTPSPTKAESGTGKHWLIEAKLKAPRQPARMIKRHHLLDTLDRMNDCNLILVTAPAGFGKTTLVAQWCEILAERKIVHAWITLDEMDSDPLNFLSYLALALTRAGVSDPELDMLSERGFEEMSVGGALNAILKAIATYGHPIVLVFDDYHRIDSREIDMIIEDIASSGPSHLTLVITSRQRPNMNLAHMIAAGHAYEIDAEALRLSLDETREILGTPVAGEMLKAFFEKTEGWAVAVQLTRILISDTNSDPFISRQPMGLSDHMAAYLTDQMIEQLPLETQDFLFKTSIAERFNVSLANALCGRRDAFDMLRKLEPLRALMMPLDERGEWYRYHHLFAECLQGLLRQRMPHSEVSLHLKASEWFEAEGLLVEAAIHARAAKRYDLCARLIEKAGGWEMCIFSGSNYLKSMLRQIPLSEMRLFPRVQLAYAYIIKREGDTESARKLLDGIAATFPMLKESPELYRDFTNVELALSAAEDSGLSPDGVAEMEQIRQTFPETDYITQGMACCMQALRLTAIADFPAALEITKHGMQAMRQANSVLGCLFCYFHAGTIALYMGDLRLAETNFAEARQIAEHNFGVDNNLKLVADLMMTVLRSWRGESLANECESIETIIDLVEKYDGSYQFFFNGFDVALILAIESGDKNIISEVVERMNSNTEWRGAERQHILAKGFSLMAGLHTSSLDELEPLADEIEALLPKDKWPDHDYRWHPLVICSQALADFRLRKKSAGSTGFLDHAIDFCIRCGAKANLTQLLIKRAMVLEMAGARERALADLLACLEISAPREIGLGLYGNTALHSLLKVAQRRARQNALDPAIGAFITTCLDKTSPPASNGSLGRDFGLSPREREILEELVQGLSNKEIARNLNVSDRTVKFHLHNIFLKTGVERRTQLIAKAHESRSIGLHKPAP